MSPVRCTGLRHAYQKYIIKWGLDRGWCYCAVHSPREMNNGNSTGQRQTQLARQLESPFCSAQWDASTGLLEGTLLQSPGPRSGGRGRGNPLLSSLSSLPSWPAFLSNFPCPAKVAFNRTCGTITAERKVWTNAQTLSHGNGWLAGGGSAISLLWGEPGWEPLKKGLNYTKL